MSTFLNALDNLTNTDNLNTDNLIFGENGAQCYEFTKNPGLDLFFKLVRDINDYELFISIDNIINMNNIQYIVELFVQCFQIRNCRGGKGERNLSYKILLHLHNYFPLTVESIVHLYKDYGYWKDLINLLLLAYNSKKYILVNTIIKIYSIQLKEDKIKVNNNDKNISLAAKWAPRENHQFSNTNRELFNQLLLVIFPELEKNKRYKAYRQLISSINIFLNTTEIAMCNGTWSKINYSYVPSLNLKKWRKAHLNELLYDIPTNEQDITGNRYPNNEDRINARINLLDTIRNPKKLISGKQLMPHEIINIFLYNNHNISKSEKELLQAQWDVLKSTLCVKKRKAIPLCDVSGSMNGLPQEVTIALGILLSEITHDAFKNRIITFSENPSWINLSDCTTLEEKIYKLSRADWNSNTNIEKVFDLILDIVDQNNLISEDIPDLVIFSDMQFDVAINSTKNDTYLEIIKAKFKSRGLICPRIIFWNLRASIGYPATQNSENIIMMSGFSQSLLKFVLENELYIEPTPLDTYLAVINDKQYDPIRVILNYSNEGILVNYKFEK
jgi:hypothetical protein